MSQTYFVGNIGTQFLCSKFSSVPRDVREIARKTSAEPQKPQWGIKMPCVLFACLLLHSRDPQVLYGAVTTFPNQELLRFTFPFVATLSLHFNPFSEFNNIHSFCRQLLAFCMMRLSCFGRRQKHSLLLLLLLLTRQLRERRVKFNYIVSAGCEIIKLCGQSCGI